MSFVTFEALIAFRARKRPWLVDITDFRDFCAAKEGLKPVGGMAIRNNNGHRIGNVRAP